MAFSMGRCRFCATSPWMRPTSILAASFRPARRTSVNAFLIHSAGRLALIDTGSGNYLLPTAGKVLANIKAAGVDPASIDTVILTHMHPDHSAGLADMDHRQALLSERRACHARARARALVRRCQHGEGDRSREAGFFPGRARAGHALQGSLAPVQRRARCFPASPPSRAPATRRATPPTWSAPARSSS